MPEGAKDYTPGQADLAKGLLDDKGQPLVSPNDVEIEMKDINNSSKKLLNAVEESFEQPPEEESLSKRAAVQTNVERRQPGEEPASQNIEEEKKGE